MDFDEATLEQYRTRLRYKVRHHLGSFCPDIEDVVQEALTRCLNALRDNKIQRPEHLGAFLSGVCNNVMQEYYRKIWRESPPEAIGAAQTPLVRPEADAMEMRDSIAAALDQMSDRDSQVLRAFYLQEQDKEDICRSAGLTDTQFRVILFRAKERFRKIYRQEMKRSASGQH